MSLKVLVADDSLTIQKVIGITLANAGYELVECLNSDDLAKKIQETNFDLVLLDFNLSDSVNGYELAKSIRTKQPETSILILLGTFDSIDEGRFSECGISDKIVKPFESTKFINKCKNLLENKTPFVATSSVLFEEKKETTTEEQTLDLKFDSWIVEAPKTEEKEPAVADKVSDFIIAPTDPLAHEIQGWGFKDSASIKYGSMVPAVIGEDVEIEKILPEAIEVAKSENFNAVEKLAEASQFLVLEKAAELATDSFDESTQPMIKLSNLTGEDSLRDPNDLTLKLGAEEDVSADSFWAVDDVVPVQSEEVFKLDVRPEPSKTAFQEIKLEVKEESKIQIQEKATNSSQSSIDEEKIIRELKNHLTPLIEKWVKEACKASVEKVSWEVIPDLAENLIRKEIKELSESVRH